MTLNTKNGRFFTYAGYMGEKAKGINYQTLEGSPCSLVNITMKGTNIGNIRANNIEAAIDLALEAWPDAETFVLENESIFVIEDVPMHNFTLTPVKVNIKEHGLSRPSA
ncbi:MAG: hypothetical protein ACI9TY_000139 [Alphaproteobacteria bacterium]|jgi:hypothetical protein